MKDYFLLSDDEKTEKINFYYKKLYDDYIDDSNEYYFNNTLQYLLQNLVMDIERGKINEDYEICDIATNLYKLFSELKYQE